MQVESLLKGKTDYVIVTYADMPLLRATTLQKLVEAQKANPGPMSMLTVIYDDPRGFGRVIRKTDGTVAEIVEEYVATPEQLAVKELNVGAYCFRADWLWDALHRIPMSKKGEYYLTDTVALAARDGLPVQAIVLEDLAETIGVNTRIHLSEAETAMRRRINEKHMLNGVTLIDPASTYIEAGVSIGADTVVWPNTYLQGETSIGQGCSIGPNTHIRESKIGDRCKVFMSVMEGALLENDVDMGPFARLRKGAHLCDHVHMGNFGEVKDSTLGPGVKMGHFSYIGNAQIGPDVNIGAGTITCNYDGEKKHPTEIGEGVFIGSDTMLVAPVKLGEFARTGAGAVVTKDVPPDSLVVGVPARVVRTIERKKKSHAV
jgi:bifunctional UDP-N-acetylglucosamine pyrophosphorylase/glucosamine-1-phosphate N-acetyltransferase